MHIKKMIFRLLGSIVLLSMSASVLPAARSSSKSKRKARVARIPTQGISNISNLFALPTISESEDINLDASVFLSVKVMTNIKDFESSLNYKPGSEGYPKAIQEKRAFINALKGVQNQSINILSALFAQACEFNCIQCVTLMLQNVPKEKLVRDISAGQLLCIATARGAFDVVSILLKHGFDPNVQDSVGYTPLHIAVCKNYEEIVRILIAHGADIYKKNKQNEVPIIFAALFDHASIALLLLEAAKENKCTDYGLVTLYYAILQGGFETAQSLILSMTDGNIEAPFDYMTTHGRETILHAFCRSEAISASILETDLYRFLSAQVKHYFERLHTADIYGNYPIHYAVRDSNQIMFDLLFDTRVEIINIQNKYLETPLYIAAANGNASVIKFLCERGADKSMKNILGFTPQDIAQINGHRHIANFLQHGLPGEKAILEPAEYVEIEQALEIADVSSIDAPEQEPCCSQDMFAASSSEPESVSRPVSKSPKLKPKSSRKRYSECSLTPDFFTDITRYEDEAVFARRQEDQQMTVVLYKQMKNSIDTKTLHNVFNMNGGICTIPNAKNEKDNFHAFAPEVDMYLGFGIHVHNENRDTYQHMLEDLNIELRKDCFAVILPGKIEGTYYLARYAQFDKGQPTRGFVGAFVYLFDHTGKCFHRFFHQNCESRHMHNRSVQALTE